jgi:hypothetical protein
VAPVPETSVEQLREPAARSATWAAFLSMSRLSADWVAKHPGELAQAGQGNCAYDQGEAVWRNFL